MAKGKRETPEERALRDREERIALLKMKQGIIEESEIIPETGYAPPSEENARQRFSSFVYRNKIFVVLGVILAAIAVIIIAQFASRHKEDLHVLLVAYDPNSMMMLYSENIAQVLEKYCPDFDGNGKVHVTVNFINRSTRESGSQYDDTQLMSLNTELDLGTAQLIITDEGFSEYFIYDESTPPEEAMSANFLPQTDKLPEEDLYCGVGIRANKTALPAQAGWADCPDNVIVLIRAEADFKESNDEKNALYRERAQIVLQNILDNNVVNPQN